MSEYEHLKKQKDEMIERHKSPGSKCPFGCPHDGEVALRSRITDLEAKLSDQSNVIIELGAKLNATKLREEGLEQRLEKYRAALGVMFGQHR